MISHKTLAFVFRITLCALLCGTLFFSPDANAKKVHHHVKHVKKAPAAPPPAWYADHDRAVELARQGDNAAALPILYNLYQQHPGDAGVTRDYLAVLSWTGGYDGQVISLYKTLPADQPDYVLEAVGHSYRNLKQYPDAIAIYQYGLNRSPNSETYAVGLIRCLAEGGYAENAMQQADVNLHSNGDRLEVLLAAGDAADQFDQAPRALQYYQRAMNIAPNNQFAVQGVVRMQDRMGNFAAAIQTADAHPGVIPIEEYRHIEGSDAADLVRQGSDAPTQAQRYAATDKAIARLNFLIQEWSSQGPDARQNIIRARLDRIIAMRNRNMMQDVISEYSALSQDGVTIPPYVLSSVGDAYMYLHQPEKARDIFIEVLKVDPKNYDVRRQLFYAYIECGQYKEAFQVIDDLANDQPYWASVTQPDQVPNPRQVAAELTSGSARLFSGQVAEADERIRPIANKYPNMAYSHETLGNLYAAHGWHQAALDQYTIGSNIGHKDIYNQVGIASQDLALQHYPEAEAVTKDLVAREPDNLAVQRAQHDLDVHNMAELRVTAGYQFKPDTTTDVNGGQGFGIDTMLYSSPIDYNWRIYGGEGFVHQKEPNQEGKIDLSRSTVGGEYRNGPWEVSGGPTFNHWDGNNRLGAYGDTSYMINDQWTVAGSGELFSRDTPLRAINSGTTASEVAAHAVWNEDEARSLRFGGMIMPFSDDNTRTALDADYTQRLFTIPNFFIDGLVSAAESQNTANTDRDYYNPGRDFIALLGPRFTQVLYQEYTTVWQHSFAITPGAYWEQNYGTDAAFRMRYEQRVRMNQTFEAGAGVNFSRQSYDGSPENDVSLTMDLVGRF